MFEPGGLPPRIGGEPLSPIHYSPRYRVHADIGLGPNKIHVPYEGQTTLPMFGNQFGTGPSYHNDQIAFRMGGTLINRGL